MTEIWHRADELEQRGEAFALATVVAVDRPVSARPGDRAIVTSTGRVEGWVGGSCSEPIVVREAIAALADRNSRLVRIRPPGLAREPGGPGIVTETTTCSSEGGLDVFVEPRLPRPRLVLAGSSPITRALAEMAGLVGYRVIAAVDDPAESLRGAEATVAIDDLGDVELGGQDAVVVATMNRYDEAALQAALQTNAGYIGLVASRARARQVESLLAGRGADETTRARVRAPAGLDLGPSTQEEIALAILAEVVTERHRAQEVADADGAFCPPEDQPVSEAVDSVCGMTVAVTADSLSARHGDVTFYFCNRGCRREFLANPDLYVRAAAGG
jgi:xanthine dehydrogenase accessory factor